MSTSNFEYEQCEYETIQRLRWRGHIVRMEEDDPARRTFDAGICGSCRRGRPCMRWKDQIKEALSSIGVTNCSRRTRSRGAWKDVLLQDESKREYNIKKKV